MPEQNERPQGVPQEARWDGRERACGVGEGEVGRKKIGTWRWWDATGIYLGESTYDGRGHLHGAVRRYQPTGELAMEGLFGSDRRVGRWAWYLSPGSSRQWLPSDIELNAGPNITRVTIDYPTTGRDEIRHFYSWAQTAIQKGGLPHGGPG